MSLVLCLWIIRSLELSLIRQYSIGRIIASCLRWNWLFRDWCWTLTDHCCGWTHYLNRHFKDQSDLNAPSSQRFVDAFSILKGKLDFLSPIGEAYSDWSWHNHYNPRFHLFPILAIFWRKVLMSWSLEMALLLDKATFWRYGALIALLFWGCQSHNLQLNRYLLDE